MANSQHTQGPGQSVFGIGQRIITLLVEMVETRLRSVVVELEEEKANLFQLLLMLGLTLLFAAFWADEPAGADHLGRRSAVPPACDDRDHQRPVARLIDRGIWTLRKARRSTFLRHTRDELANDRALLEDERR